MKKYNSRHISGKTVLFGSYISVFKWIVLLAAYLYLTVVLSRFDRYDELWMHFGRMAWPQAVSLVVVLLLLPLNLFLESEKWKLIVSKTEKINLSNAFKAVLAGFASGFLTPNRTGEFLGRIVFLQKTHRKVGVVYSVMNSLTQNLILVVCGLPAAVIYFIVVNKDISPDMEMYFYAVTCIFIALVIFYFALPVLAKTKIWGRFLSFSSDIRHYSSKDLAQILSFSLMRYAVFSIQFYAMLYFFGVELEGWQAVIAIPANYLFVTFTPSLAFSEAAVRSSYAVVFIGAFSDQLAGIAFAGFTLWFINFGIPMLTGSLILVKTKRN